MTYVWVVYINNVEIKLKWLTVSSTFYGTNTNSKLVISSEYSQEGGNNGPVLLQTLKTFPSLNSMLSSFSRHHLSCEDDIVYIWSTLDTSFMSIIVNNISFLCDSSTGFKIFLSQHRCFPCKSFNHSSFYEKRRKINFENLEFFNESFFAVNLKPNNLV